MNSKILVCYKSVTGFTKRYAEMIADEMDCTVMDFKNLTAEMVSQYGTVVFGGRLFAGSVDGLKKRLMMKAVAAVMKRKTKNKKDKTEKDKEFEQTISN